MSTLPHRLRFYLRGECTSPARGVVDIRPEMALQLYRWSRRAEALALRAKRVVPEPDLIYGDRVNASVEWHTDDRTRFAVYATAEGCSTLLSSMVFDQHDMQWGRTEDEMDAMWLGYLYVCSIPLAAP